MNRERAKELLPIIQAYADGKIIEVSLHGGDWRESIDPDFMGHCQYRIKPEKKVGYFNIYGDKPQVGSFHYSRRDADEAGNGSVGSRIACIRIEYTEGEFHD